MSKVFKAVAVVAGVAAIFLPPPFRQVAQAVAIVASVGAQLTQKKPPTTGSANEVRIGPNMPMPYPMGRTYIGGSMIHDVGYGGTVDDVPNPYSSSVFVWSSCGPVQEIEAFQADFTTISFSGTAAQGYYGGFMWLSTQLGTTPQAAALTGPHGAIPGWSSAHKLSGFAAGLVTLKFDRKGKVFASGVPQFGAIGKWVKAYDPRKDSTYPGGSGAHRWNNESTWEWTENPSLHALTYARGRYQNSKKVFGCGFRKEGIDLAAFVALANVCDANGWKVGGTIFEPGSRWDNLKRILEVAAAEPVFVAGRLTVKFSAPKVALDTITAADLAPGEYIVPAMKTWKARKNGLIPKYRSEAHKWEHVQSDLVTDGTYVAEDGEDKHEEYHLELCQEKNQAAQVTAYKLVNAREFGPIELPCKPRLIEYVIGDALNVNIPDANLNNQLCVIIGRVVHPDTGIVELTLESETTAKHAFALGKAGTAPPTPTITPGSEVDAVVQQGLRGRGEFSAIETYYQGNIVQHGGSSWEYISGTPTIGNVPPSPPDTSNAYWRVFAEAGAALYTWEAYADSANGVTNFTTGDRGTRTYIGLAFNKDVEEESANPADYSWSKIVGEPGAPAKAVRILLDASNFRYNGAGTLSPSGQAIRIDVVRQNIAAEAAPSWSAVAYDASGASLGAVQLRTTPSGSTAATTQTTVYLQGALVPASAVRVLVTGTVDGISDTRDIGKLQDGANARTLYVSSNTQQILYNEAGALSPNPQVITINALRQNNTGALSWSAEAFNSGGASLGSVQLQSTASAGGPTATSQNTVYLHSEDVPSAMTQIVVTATSGAPDNVFDQISINRDKEGANARTIYVTSDVQHFFYDKAGALTPASQVIELKAQRQNNTGTLSWSATAYNVAGASLGSVLLTTTPSGSTAVTTQIVAYLRSANLPAGTDRVVVLVQSGAPDNVTDSISIASQREGATGPSGPALVIKPSAAEFNYVNGAIVASQTIQLDAIKQGVTGTIAWLLTHTNGDPIAQNTGWTLVDEDTITISSAQYAAIGNPLQIRVRASIGGNPPEATQVIARHDELSPEYLNVIAYNRNDAMAADGTILDISADGVISKSEKRNRLVPLWNSIQGTYAQYRAQAVAMGVSVAAIDTAYSSLNTYIASYSTMLNTNVATAATSDLRTYVANYYDKEADLVAAMNEKAATTATWSGTSNDNGKKPSDNAGTSVTLVASGPNVTIAGNSAFTTHTAAEWVTGVVSRESFKGTAFVSARAAAAYRTAIGLSLSNASANLASNSYAIARVDSGWIVYASGDGIVGGASGVNDNTILKTDYNGLYVRFWTDNILRHSIYVGPNLTFYACVSFWFNGAGFSDLQFGPFDNQVWTSHISDTSGQALDSRLLNTSNNYGLRSLSAPPTFSATAQEGSATVNLAADGVFYNDWGGSIALPSASFPGLANSTRYYFWRNMPVDGSGSSYGYSTNVADALGVGKAYFGFYTTPATLSSGGGGGGGGYYGGDNCVDAEALVPTANRGIIRAGEVREGDLLYVLSEDFGQIVTTPCTGNCAGENDRCILILETGERLTLSINTPMTLRDGSWIVAANAWHREIGVMRGDVLSWEKVADVKGLGSGVVAKIRCNDGTFAAGDQRGAYLMSHNPNNYAKP